MARLILTLGTFDLLHAGHIALLRRCAALGEVVVGLNTDDFITRYRGVPPVITYVDREAVLAALRDVAAVVPNDQSGGSALDVIEAIHPTHIAIGWDWRDRDYLGQLGVTQADLDRLGCVVLYLPYTPGAAGSSTAIKRRIAEAQR